MNFACSFRGQSSQADSPNLVEPYLKIANGSGSTNGDRQVN